VDTDQSPETGALQGAPAPAQADRRGGRRGLRAIIAVGVAIAVLGTVAVVKLVQGPHGPHPIPVRSPRPGPVASASPSGVPMPVGDLPGWKQVFADDFSGRSIDRNHWGPYTGQPGGDPGGWWDPSHIQVHDGILELQSFRDPAFDDRWVSGGLSSAPALRQTYGKYLVRYRMDPGFGVAGILLLWPSDNNWPPEVDFAEDGGGDRSHTTATLHYGSTDEQIQRETTGDFTRWHTIGVEWTPERLDFTLDGSVWTSITSHVPDKAMEMDLQTQAGTCGQVHTPCPDASTPDHVTMQIDWVVAYRPA
jgi:beta-glucanase (GH16 family)